jgi:hypothetical protein
VHQVLRRRIVTYVTSCVLQNKSLHVFCRTNIGPHVATNGWLTTPEQEEVTPSRRSTTRRSGDYDTRQKKYHTALRRLRRNEPQKKKQSRRAHATTRFVRPAEEEAVTPRTRDYEPLAIITNRLQACGLLLRTRYDEVPHGNKPGITQACYNEVSVNYLASHPHGDDDPGAQTMPHH